MPRASTISPLRTRWPTQPRRAQQGNLHKEGEKLARQNKLFVRRRLELLLDVDSFVEDGLLANASATDLPADGVVTGTGTIDGRPVAVMANDPTVKAGSWGARTVEKIIRITELALQQRLPMFWLVDSAGARITDQVDLFPGRRGAGQIFYNQVRLSGKVPQICCLFGPSRSGRGLHPRLLRRGHHGGGQRLHVPRVAPDGGDGDRRDRLPRGDGRRPDACVGVRLRGSPRRRRRGRARPGVGRVQLPPVMVGRRSPRPTSPPPPVATSTPRSCPRRRPGATTCTT